VRPLAADLAAAARLARRLPSLLRRPISHGEAATALETRLADRETDFLGLVEHAVFARPSSPYRALLRHAGCDPGDLVHLVETDGIEGALRALLRVGVYLTADEMKGRRAVERGSFRLALAPDGLRNPLAAADLPLSSGGGRGTPSRVDVDLGFLREGFTDHRLVLEARGGLDWSHAVWGVPGGGVLLQLLRFAVIGGAEPPRLFSLVQPSDRALPARYRWSHRLLHAVGRRTGRPFPPPVHAPVARPDALLRWLDDVRARGGTPHLHLFASAAVRLAEAAVAAGTDLGGVQLLVSGEPTTPARLAAIRRAGATVLPQMGNTEVGGTVACGCLAPVAPDEMHLLSDLVALIQPGESAPPGLPPRALLASSLRPRAPLVLLNASLGDTATLETGDCGCPLGRWGWTTRLSGVRSFEKLTAGGMTFHDADLVRVLEMVLPARFGGGPLDYQLVEEEMPDGQAVLRLVVDPRLGPVDPGALSAAFLEALAAGAGAQRVMALAWRDAGLLSVDRRRPESTPAGKINHLHVRARGAPP
jgi:hypothetical protein